MDIHPILVHFPIALLTIYALAECARIPKLQNQAYWFYVKAVLLIVGSASSVATYLSGTLIEDKFSAVPQLAHVVEVHSSFALATVLVFGLLAACYLVRWIVLVLPKKAGPVEDKGLARVWHAMDVFSKFMLKGKTAAPLAALGLLLVTITGALGGALVHGPDVDPFVKFIYGLLIGN